MAMESLFLETSKRSLAGLLCLRLGCGPDDPVRFFPGFEVCEVQDVDWGTVYVNRMHRTVPLSFPHSKCLQNLSLSPSSRSLAPPPSQLLLSSSSLAPVSFSTHKPLPGGWDEGEGVRGRLTPH